MFEHSVWIPVYETIILHKTKPIVPPPLHLLGRPKPDAQLSTCWTAAPGGGGHPRVLRGAGQPAGSAWRAGVWERGEEHIHHGPDGGAEQAEGATRQQQTPAPGQGPEPAGGRDSYCECREYRPHWEDRDHARQGKKQGGHSWMHLLIIYITWVCRKSALFTQEFLDLVIIVYIVYIVIMPQCDKIYKENGFVQMCSAAIICVYSVPDLLRQQLITQSAP